MDFHELPGLPSGFSGLPSLRAVGDDGSHDMPARPHARTPARPHARTPARPHARTPARPHAR
ncbi:hypothetical protein ACFVDT_36180, partial [Streptomyces sp. NPDC057699]|uniref:hypothetical protein n=1 Tax=Streptomyces sp. NPDC057699 TaxID=3346220 RepID=UPI0036A76E6F